jgi:transposase InsO family protein
MARVVCLHGVPKKIISDRGSQFTSRLWKSFHENMDTKLKFSAAYHPQTDGQTKRTNQVLEDMLRACALQHGSSWDKSLPDAEFSYNSYQASLKMSPFKTLYGRIAELLYFWTRLEEDRSLGLNLFKRQKNKFV